MALQGLVVLAEILVNHPDVVQGPRLAERVLFLYENLETVVVMLERFIILADALVDGPDPVQRPRPSDSVTDLYRSGARSFGLL